MTETRQAESSVQAARVPAQQGPAARVAPPAAAPIADPGPLGLAAFAMTTFVLSVFNANLISNAKLEAVYLPLALFYGGIAQVLAGMWEFRKDNTFGATAFTSYGAFWLSLASYVRYIAPKLPAADAHTATGLFLLAWTIFTAYMLIASLRTSGALMAVFAVLFATFLFLTWGVLAQKTGLVHLAGWLGLVTAVLAWYTSFAGLLAATWGRPVLPTMPRPKLTA